jgi:hypothetical protein
MMWLHSVLCLSCVLGLREEEEEEEADLKSMTPPSSLATKVKGGKCLSLEYNGVLQVVAILTALLQGEV